MNILFSIVLVLLPLSIFAQENNTQLKPEPQTIVFDTIVHDFGTVKEEVGSVTTTFTFENKGDKPLMISNVQASCGCTTPDWTREPVAPGKKGHIKVTYSTTGRVYSFNRTITVRSNGNPSSITLRIKGNVIK